MTMERKNCSAFVTKVDATGVVEAIVAVMGNLDLGNDIIHPGAFTKTLTERRGKIRVLDQHRTDSVLRVLGKCLEARELKRDELPAELLERFPEANGGLWTKTQFLLDTPEGDGAFKRLKAGALDEWSIGYDPADQDYSQMKIDGKRITVRNLRTLKLYEYSPVLFGMNDATTTLSAKNDEPKKEWDVFKVGGKWHVYKLDADGKRTGESLGKHNTEQEAQGQVTALYDREKPKKPKSVNLSELVSSVSDAFSSAYNVPNSSMWYWVREVYDDYIVVCCHPANGPTEYYQVSYMANAEGDFEFAPRAEWVEGDYVFVPGSSDGDEMSTASKAGRILAARNAARVQQLNALMTQVSTVMEEIMQDAGMLADEGDGEGDAEAEKPKKPKTEKTEAGPDTPEVTPPTYDELKHRIEVELALLQLEV